MLVAAIAAAHLRRHHERVAILDIDVHHGNGTQAIFYDRADVLTVSIHADPMDYYPFFNGHAHETGQGAGEGALDRRPLTILAVLFRAWAAMGLQGLEDWIRSWVHGRGGATSGKGPQDG